MRANEKPPTLLVRRYTCYPIWENNVLISNKIKDAHELGKIGKKIPILGTYPGNSPSCAQGGVNEGAHCGFVHDSEKLGTA